MGVREKFSHKNEISTMTHTFLLIFCYILPPAPHPRPRPPLPPTTSKE